MATQPLDRTIDSQTLRIFIANALEHKKELLLSLTYPFSNLLTSIVAPFAVSHILASLTHATFNTRYFIVLAGAALLGFLSNRFGFVRLMTYGAKAQTRLQTACLDTLLRHSVSFHNNHISGKLVSEAIDFPNAFAALNGTFFIDLVPFALSTLVGLIIVSSRSWQLGLGLFIIVLVTIGSTWRESRRRSSIRSQRLAASKAVTGHLADTIVNAQTVKTFAQEDYEMATHGQLNSSLEQLRIRDWSRAAKAGSNRMGILLLLQLGFVYLIIQTVRSDPTFLAIGIYSFTYMLSLTNRLFDLGSMFRRIEDGLFQAAPMTQIFLTDTSIVDVPNAPELQITKGKIVCDTITFHYNDSTVGQTVFKKLSFTVNPGEKIGIVGPSGGGKSTLTRLLLRHEDLTGGSITIDGQNIQAVSQASLHQAIAYVPQEPLLFQRSITDNISYGNLGASQANVVAVAKKAQADDFIQQLPQGYETLVGERGVKLSGGQRQRVAIARAMLKDAPILILDEATSALDSQSEQAVQTALWKLMEHKTALVVAHRLSTIQRMDRIIVLHEGAIIEQGTHSALLKQNGLYAKLWAHQSGGFIED